MTLIASAALITIAYGLLVDWADGSRAERQYRAAHDTKTITHLPRVWLRERRARNPLHRDRWS